MHGRGSAKGLKGLEGNDLLAVGAGADKLAVGAGAEVFDFARGDERDYITCVSLTEDHIHCVSAHKRAHITFGAQAGSVPLRVGTARVVVDGITLAQVHHASHFQF